MNSYAVSLDQFEGPLDLLVHLLQKKEVDASQIEVRKITHPFSEMAAIGHPRDYFDVGADFILLAAHVALLKSKLLLPIRQAYEELSLEGEEDAKFEIIHHLIDYCRFKEAAATFAEMEGRQGEHFERGLKMDENKKPLGLSGVLLSDLETLFQEILKKSIPLVGKIEEEEFRVQDKIIWLRQRIREQRKVLFIDLFAESQNKLELIVIFLSILELIKVGEIKVIKDMGIYLYAV